MERKRLALDIPEDLHNELKSHCAMNGVSMTRWILRAIMRQYNFEIKTPKVQNDDGK